jgi:hypothetical protein
MIVRIMGEGQFELTDDTLRRLNELDGRLEATLEAGSRDEFSVVLEEMVTLVRTEGKRLPADSLKPSDAILPAGDTTADELRALLKEEGLIPGR